VGVEQATGVRIIEAETVCTAKAISRQKEGETGGKKSHSEAILGVKTGFPKGTAK